MNFAVFPPFPNRLPTNSMNGSGARNRLWNTRSTLQTNLSSRIAGKGLFENSNNFVNFSFYYFFVFIRQMIMFFLQKFVLSEATPNVLCSNWQKSSSTWQLSSSPPIKSPPCRSRMLLVRALSAGFVDFYF